MRLATLRTAGGTTATVVSGDAWAELPHRDVGALLSSPTGLVDAGAASRRNERTDREHHANERRIGSDGVVERGPATPVPDPHERGVRSHHANERHIGSGPAPAGDPGELPPLPGGASFAPVVPRPSKIVCCGHNYAGHISEMGRALPSHPTLFTKFADTLTGPYDAVTVPDWAGGLDWEAELAAVVGAPLYRATPDEAAAAVAGWTAANDLSVRAWQHRTGQWLPGKAFDATTPLGPVLVTADELDPRTGLQLTCRVNGETVQRGDTADLVFDAAALLSYVSAFTRLHPGDVVLTGTPAGVGAASDPPRALADGDVVEVGLTGVGTLRTLIHIENTAEGAAA